MLRQGRPVCYGVNLACVDDRADMSSYSLHAVASGPVKIEFFVSSILSKSIHELNWMSCQDIPTIELDAKQNYFHQGEWKTTATFLAVKITPLTEADTLFSLSACFGSVGSPMADILGGSKRPKTFPNEFTVMQGNELFIAFADILQNDIYETPIKEINIVGDVLGGSIQQKENQFLFMPAARFGEEAGFKYILVDEKGKKSHPPCPVTINIEMLPNVEAYLFPEEELDAFLNNYVPPTFAEIFKSWPRFSNSAYFPSGTTPTGEAASWEMMSTDQVRCTVNSNYPTGFIAPDSFTDYEFQADLSSSRTDDDDVSGLIIAFARINNTNHALWAIREPGGVMNWTNHKQFAIGHLTNSSWTLIKDAPGTKCFNGAVKANAGAWQCWGNQSPTRMKVTRRGNLIKVQASPWKSLDLSAGETIEINLDDYPALSWAKAKLPYGYACYSQQYSTYSNVKFTGAGALDTQYVYNLTNGQALEFINGKWTYTGKSVQDILNYPREVINPLNGKKYIVEKDHIREVTETAE